MSGRHGTAEELLALRDGEGSGWMREHITTCAACAAELRGMEQMRARLRALPAFHPPRDRWEKIAPLVRQERERRRVRSWAGIATAAALSGLTFLALRPGTSDIAAERAALQRVMAQSSALEQALQAIGPGTHSMPAEAAMVAAELQDRLSQLDVRLASPQLTQRSQALELWRERAGVLSALVDVHSTRAAAASF